MSDSPFSQRLTPELREWVIEQARNRIAPETVLESMLGAGWSEDVAIEAMQAALSHHLRNETPPDGAAALPPLPAIDLKDSPPWIEADGRRVDVLASMDAPRLVVLGGLLSHEECAALIEAARSRLARSLTVEGNTGGEAVNGDRTSRGMFFERAENELIATIERRIAKLLDWPAENGEGLQVLHYAAGAEYKPHHDYFNPDEPGAPALLKRGGQRVATLIMYLNEPEKGGATLFPDLRLTVAARRGNAVFFSYPQAHPGSRTLHGGAPVLAGEKWIATKWLRERRFD